MHIRRNEAHLWTARHPLRIDPERLESCFAIMDEPERARFHRYRFEKHRIQHLVTRNLVRRVLSLYTGVPPAALRFVENDYGKPSLSGAACASLRFNLSHADGATALVVARGREVGVDIEPLSRSGDFAGIAQRYFAPLEWEQAARLPPETRRERLLELWTLKEAFIKGVGKGLSLPLDSFAFSFPGRGDIVFSWLGEPGAVSADWAFRNLKPYGEFLLAVASDDWEGAADLAMWELESFETPRPAFWPVEGRSMQGTAPYAAASQGETV